MYKLIRNEFYKMLGKKRLYITLTVLLIMISSFAYGQYDNLQRTRENLAKRIGVTAITDWRSVVQQQILDNKARLDNPYQEEERRVQSRVRMEQSQFYLDHNINTVDLTTANFTTRIISQSMSLFLPLLMILLAADLVSGEMGAGTIKFLMVQGIPRWKVLLSKYIALLGMETIVLFFSFFFSILISGIFFGYGGWMEPVATGFKILGGKLDTSNVAFVVQWQFILMSFGLAYFVSVVVGAISMMISVLVNSSIASLGIILSILIGGSQLTPFMANWQLPRYLFTCNLNLMSYISGSFQSIPGMTMAFSLSVLVVWTVASVVVSFAYFNKRDILV